MNKIRDIKKLITYSNSFYDQHTQSLDYISLISKPFKEYYSTLDILNNEIMKSGGLNLILNSTGMQNSVEYCFFMRKREENDSNNNTAIESI